MPTPKPRLDTSLKIRPVIRQLFWTQTAFANDLFQRVQYLAGNKRYRIGIKIYVDDRKAHDFKNDSLSTITSRAEPATIVSSDDSSKGSVLKSRAVILAERLPSDF